MKPVLVALFLLFATPSLARAEATIAMRDVPLH